VGVELAAIGVHETPERILVTRSCGRQQLSFVHFR
jgi:hypothetical protein